MSSVPNRPRLLRTIGLAFIIVGVPGTLETFGIWEPNVAYVAGGILGIIWMWGAE